MDQIDAVDIYGTFTEAEARRIGVAPFEEGLIFGLPTAPQIDSVVFVEGEKQV
jgi:NCS1 family nucleobase:cation symporter-1